MPSLSTPSSLLGHHQVQRPPSESDGAEGSEDRKDWDKQKGRK